MADLRAGIATALLLLSGAGAQADVAGPASVIDGDTIAIRDQRVRLFGIDAPERRQLCLAGTERWPCGRAAARALRQKIAGRPVACAVRDRDRYGRIVAVCRTGGTDLNAWIVTEGWALAARRYTTDYVRQEEDARAGRKGVWRGALVPPSYWRRGWRLQRRAGGPGEAAPAPKRRGACRIKGNIGAGGRRIYHVPGGRFYNRTRIDPSRGERWFCSEAEARAAGWRRSRQ